MDPAESTLFEFIEVDPGYPKPIRSWFYPGRIDGREFIYPKDQAMDIVAHSRQGVMTAEGRIDFHDLNTVEIAALDPDDVVATETAQVTRTPAEPEEFETEKVETDTDVTREKPADIEPTEPAELDTTEPEVTEPAPTPAQDTDMDEDAEDEESEETLPATAGALPLIGLIGALSLGLGLGVRRLSNRS